MLNKLDCIRFYLRNFYFSGLKKVPSAIEGVRCEYSEWAWQAKIRQEAKQPQLVRHSQTADSETEKRSWTSCGLGTAAFDRSTGAPTSTLILPSYLPLRPTHTHRHTQAHRKCDRGKGEHFQSENFIQFLRQSDSSSSSRSHFCCPFCR